MRHRLALVACLVFTGSIVQPASAERGDRRSKLSKKAKREGKQAKRQVEVARLDDDDDDERWLDDDRDRRIDRPARRTRARRTTRAKSWHLAVGPYLWAASVDANLSLGNASASTGIDFMEIKRHARYGIPVLAEVRYRRLAIYADLMYGVVALDGDREVGPFTVRLAGTATSLMIDSAAGYRLAGVDPQSRLSLEARVGLRYQRTAIAGSVNVAGADVSNPRYVDAAADAVVGAQVIARPWPRLGVGATFDLGVYGVSTRTWSAAADASWRVSDRVLLSLGWRTLTTQRPNVSIVMHGPRAAFQLMF